MQVKTYANKYQIDIADIIETLSGKFNKTVWQPSSELKASHTVLLDSVFGNTRLQLPSSNQQELVSTGDIEISQSSQLTEETVERLNVETGELVQIVQASLNLRGEVLQQLLDNSHDDILNRISANSNRTISHLMIGIKADYDTLTKHKPVTRYKSNTTEVDEMMSKLRERGIIEDPTKSQ